MGDPREWYNDRLRCHSHRDRHGLPYLRILAEETATPNGVFGIKVMLGCLGRFGISEVWSEVCDLYRPQLVWLRRRDKLRQAISRYRAMQTDEWQRSSGTPPNRTPVPFDAAAIWDGYDKIVHWEQCWEGEFRGLGARPLEVCYEQIVANPQAVVDKICRLMGVATRPIDVGQCPIAVQRDELTELWVRRLTGGLVGNSGSYVDWASEG